jgi:ABC-type multidrug transport system permease subunit
LAARDEEPTLAALTEAAAVPRRVELKVERAGHRREIPTGFSQAVPGTMVMFTLFVLLTSGSVLIVIERKQGLLRRLASSPVSRGSVVLGKWGGRLGLGLIQIAFAMIVGSVLFHVDWGPNLGALLLVLLAYAGLIAAIGMLLGNFARTEGQAVGIGVLAGNVISALGGCWWPIEVTPLWMQKLSLFLPTGIAMDALHKLVNFGAGPETVIPHIAVMGVAAVAAGWLAARVFRFQ